MYSNSYIFRFASIMVIIVAALLAGAAMVLKPFQENNKRVEKIQSIMAAAGVPADKGDALALYENKYLQEELVLSLDGEVSGRYAQGELKEGVTRAFDVDLKKAQKNIADFKAGKSTQTPGIPLFVLKNNAQETVFVVPLRGKGLWGPIWGFLALKEDCKTVIGATFDHKGETPGLGAEISTAQFQAMFAGRTIFDDQGDFTSIAVVKGGVAASNINPAHGVDAITGGTITSNGLADMLRADLQLYVPFFEKQR